MWPIRCQQWHFCESKRGRNWCVLTLTLFLLSPQMNKRRLWGLLKRYLVVLEKVLGSTCNFCKGTWYWVEWRILWYRLKKQTSWKGTWYCDRYCGTAALVVPNWYYDSPKKPCDVYLERPVHVGGLAFHVLVVVICVLIKHKRQSRCWLKPLLLPKLRSGGRAGHGRGGGDLFWI